MFDFITELVKIDVLYTDSDDSHIVLKSYVKSIEPDYILIDFLFYRKSEFNIPEGSLIKVNFKNKTGVHSGTCYVLGSDNSRLGGIKISFPKDVEFIQQREYVRIPLKLKAELVVFPDDEDDDIKVYDINTLDISGSGFCFISDKPLEKHLKIIGVINLSDPNEKPIEVTLKHVYSKTLIAAGKAMYKNAFTFIEIDEKSKDKILKEIFLYELNMRKKGI